MMRILIIEDDIETANYIHKGLKEAGHIIDVASDGEVGLDYALSQNYDVLIVDRMLPKRDGLSAIMVLREKDIQTPVLILSALGDVDDRVLGLKAGGDDYLVKPFAFSELLARVESLNKRNYTNKAKSKLKVSNLSINLLNRKVKRDEEEILLQPREFLLLEYLMKNSGQIVTRTMLLENVWDYHFDPQTNVVDVHISRLRSKIDKEFSPKLLYTVRGAGYMLSAEYN